MNDDASLLREFAQTGTESAFAELVRRHIDLMHSAAIRRRGDELTREWGEPPAKPTPAESAALMEKLRVELERVAVATVGEKGRAIVAEMVKRHDSPPP